jgi:hypothetical protein
MKRLLVAGVVSAGLLLGVGATVVNAAPPLPIDVFTVSVNTARVNGETVRECEIVNLKKGVPTSTLTTAQKRQLRFYGITNPEAQCTINGVPPTPI